MRIFYLEKKPRVQPWIVFTYQDLVGVHLPYEDAPVVKLRVANYDIKRILINNGSAVNVVFLSTLRKIEFGIEELSL